MISPKERCADDISDVYVRVFSGPIVGALGGRGDGGAQDQAAASTTAPQTSCYETDRGVV